MTPQAHNDIPCAYAKAIMWVMGLLIVLAGMAAASQSKMTQQTESNDRAIVEMRVDIGYIKKSVDEIKAAVRP